MTHTFLLKRCEAPHPSGFCYLSSYAHVCFWWSRLIQRLVNEISHQKVLLLCWANSIVFTWLAIISGVLLTSEIVLGKFFVVVRPSSFLYMKKILPSSACTPCSGRRKKKAWWWRWCIVAILLLIFYLIPIFNKKKSNTIPLPHGHYGLVSVTAHYNTGSSLIRMIQDPMSPGQDGLRAINTEYIYISCSYGNFHL